MDSELFEFLRFLGRGGEVPKETLGVAGECLERMQEAASPSYVKKTFGIIRAPEGILPEGTSALLDGAEIIGYLECCVRIAVFAATLGGGADEQIRQYEDSDKLRASVSERCASFLIEKLCEKIGLEISREAAEDGLRTTPRFHPGRGELPLDVLPKLIDIADAGGKIGVTCTESLTLLPKNSAAAMIGLGENACAARGDCVVCMMNKNCCFRR